MFDTSAPAASHTECLVFAYGSLLNPASLARTLPGLDDHQCLPAHCFGMLRSFGVAFPNDGSQPDKWYADDRGHRPARILFAELTPDAGRTTNGVLIPVTRSGLAYLQARERRYQLIDVSDRITLWEGPRPALPIAAFIGRAEFTRPAEVAAGVVPAAYLALIRAGVRFWDQRAPGFQAAFTASTLNPPPERVSVLSRFDRVGATQRGFRT